MQKNIYAYTANNHPYPEFVSLNKEGDKITLTVREPAKPGRYSDKDCGTDVSVVLPRVELAKLLEALIVDAVCTELGS